jgi:dTDP-glucose 4,6-dehydratase
MKDDEPRRNRQDMKVLVTGGLGVVGTALVGKLRSRGHDVWICDHHHHAQYIRCDVGSFMHVERLFEGRGFDLVYHLAAEFGRWNGEDYYDTLWRTNAVGTKNLIRMQEKHRFKMVFASSSEVYGDYAELMHESVMEEHGARQLNDYALSKWVNEMQILNSADVNGTETVRVRLFNTYGPGEYYSPYRSVICRFIYCALFDLPYTVYTNHRRTSTYISDTVGTLANIAEKFRPGEVYNIGGAEHHDIRLLSDMILKCAGKTDRLVSYREAEPLTTGQKLVSIEKAMRDLDHRPAVTLEEGIPRTVDWMRAEYAAGSGGAP